MLLAVEHMHHHRVLHRDIKVKAPDPACMPAAELHTPPRDCAPECLGGRLRLRPLFVAARQHFHHSQGRRQAWRSGLLQDAAGT
eukprot:3695406-Prymnesium_polylepis.2